MGSISSNIDGEPYMNKTDPIANVLRQKGGDIWTVSPETSVFDALELMAEREVGALLVMEGSQLAGVVSERDYARKVILQGRSSRDTKVREIMTAEVITVTPRHTIDECMKLMTELRVRHLPVTEAAGIAGVVSLGDLVKYVISAQENEIQHLQAYIAGAYPA
jgi:CBS domain-containing protein